MNRLWDQARFDFNIWLSRLGGKQSYDELPGVLRDSALVERISEALWFLEAGVLDESASDESWKRAVPRFEERMDGDPVLQAYEEALRGAMDVPLASRTFLSLARRRARHLLKTHGSYAKRPPDAEEGYQFASAMLAYVADKRWWKQDLDIHQFSDYLAGTWLAFRDPYELDLFIQLSKESWSHWDALKLICAKLREGGDLEESRVELHYKLLLWNYEADHGHRSRPEERPAPPNRRSTMGYLSRGRKICRTIELLEQVGMPPTGGREAGCSVVADALAAAIDEENDEMPLTERSIRLIWQRRETATNEYDEKLFKRLMPESLLKESGPGSSSVSPPSY